MANDIEKVLDETDTAISKKANEETDPTIKGVLAGTTIKNFLRITLFSSKVEVYAFY